ncbi:MAG TPA: cytochrome c [Pseudomonadales bacterium]|jgi:mono/diheme cytochrome c family protein
MGIPIRVLIVLLSALAIAGCQTAAPEGERSGYEYDGRNLYLGYCASCHGLSGAGDGPVAAGMAFKMEDLRTLEARNGTFPADRLREVIDGRTLRSVHGTNDMPVWGWQFLLAEDSEEHVAARIDALVEYLRSIQHGDSDPAAP